MRVPCPAAITRTRGAATAPQIKAGAARASSSGLPRKFLADLGDRDQRPAGEDQVDADEQADRPIGAGGELGEDQDPDDQPADAGEADPARVRLAAADK